MADSMALGIQRDDSRETVTRDSLASLARRRNASQENDRTEAVRKEEESAERPTTGNAANDRAICESHESYESSEYSESSDNDDSTQILPPSFIPTATGRIRPVAGAFPAIQSTTQEKHARLRRSIRSLSAGSLRRNGGDADSMSNAGKAMTGNGDASTPRIASSAPHYVD